MTASGLSRRLGGAAVLALLLALPAMRPGVLQAAEPLSADPAIVAMLPQDIRSKGVLTVGSDATYPPFESIDPGTHEIVGFDADIARGLASLMGLKLKLVNTSFDTLIPSLAAGKFDIAMSSIGDTKAREKVVDFVTYYWNSTSALVPEGNPKHLATNALCGAEVGVERGSLQHTTMLPALTAACTAAGKPAIKSAVFKANTDSVLALASSRIDAVLNDAVPNQYAAERSAGKFQVAGPLMHNKNPGGVAIPKNSGLQKPVLAAMKKLMADGAYKTAIEKWDVRAIAIDNPTIDGALE